MIRFFAALVSAVIAVVFISACSKKSGDSEVTKTEFEKAAESLPNHRQTCDKMQSDFNKLCRESGGGQCVLRDEDAVSRAIQIIEASPQLSEKYSATLTKFWYLPKPTRGDVTAAISLIAKDCWSLVHIKVWSTLAESLKKMETTPRPEKMKDLLKPRMAKNQTVVGPSLLSLIINTRIIEISVDLGLIKISKQAREELLSLKQELQTAKTAINDKFSESDGPLSSISGKNQAKSTHADTENRFDAIKIRGFLKQEIETARSLRLKLEGWLDKYKLASKI